jgi:glycosyltransferase involved in cell wall biosynthesis
MPTRILFLGTSYAGWKTRFLNLKARTEDDLRIDATYRVISGWRDGGAIEAVSFLPRGVRGRLRATIEGAAFAALPRPDVIWLGGVANVITPYLWAQLGRLRRPVVYELDWTLEQQEAFAPAYFGRPPRSGLRLRLARLRERLVWSTTTLFTPMSTWAARSLVRQGIPAERVRVIHPGVNLDEWRMPAQRRSPHPAEPLKLLFVGGDFERKGGPMLVDVVRKHFAGRCELDLVTPAPVESGPGLRVHRAGPNSPLLHRLYAEADLFVLPTRADCFGHVVVESLACGVPVIVTDVGGVSDIVDDGRTGWLIDPSRESLVAALERALARRAELPAMGGRGRLVVEQRLDGRRNDAVLVDLLLHEARRGAVGKLHAAAT